MAGMVDLVLGEAPVEEIFICPYDSNHKIKLKSMEAHLEKCRGVRILQYYGFFLVRILAPTAFYIHKDHLYCIL